MTARLCVGQPGWYEHIRTWSPPKWRPGASVPRILSPKRALDDGAQEGERPTIMVRRHEAV